MSLPIDLNLRMYENEYSKENSVCGGILLFLDHVFCSYLSEEDTVIPEHYDPFKLLPPFPSNTVASREVYSVLRGTKRPCFFSRTLAFSKCTRSSTAIIQCPRTPIPHDKERIQKLLDLASKHHDH